MKLTDIKNGNLSAEWAEKGYELPKFDVEAVKAKTHAEPTWVHFGAGNIFRAFPAAILNDALNSGKYDRGVIVAESFDYEIIDKAYRPYDNLSLLVCLKSTGDIEKKVIASVTESLKADYSFGADWARLVEITRAGRTLTETEMRLQMNYLTKLIEGSVAGVAKNATRKGIADMYAHIEVPEWLKAASRERFGIISEEFMGCFNNKPREMQAARLEEISGFDDDVDLKAPIEPMEHIYYGELKKVRSLVAASASTGSADTQRHYRLLLYKIDQALK